MHSHDIVYIDTCEAPISMAICPLTWEFYFIFLLDNEEHLFCMQGKLLHFCAVIVKNTTLNITFETYKDIL